jgi:heptosyltransferase I
MLPLPEPPKHLCLIRLSAIGDTCHTVPVIRTLQARWPSTRLTWVIGKAEHGLMRGLDGVDFVVLDKAAGWRGYAAVRRALHDEPFDALLHMHASTRANVVSLFVRTPLRLGFDRARARDAQWLFTNARLAPQPRRHVMDGLLEFAEHIGAPRGPLRWDIPLADEDRAFAATVLSTAAPTLVISPCTGQRLRNFRNWSIESYAAVADYAHARYGAQVVLTGGATAVEQRYGEGIVARSAAAPLNLIGRTTLKQLLAVLERTSVVLCPDSGPAHMATAVRTPVVGLYATSNRFRTGPYFSQHLVVDKYPEAVARGLGRPVESVRWGQRVRDPDAMNLIAVADVTAKLDMAFAERAIRPVATPP